MSQIKEAIFHLISSNVSTPEQTKNGVQKSTIKVLNWRHSFSRCQDENCVCFWKIGWDWK